jgi:hypothetical protein
MADDWNPNPKPRKPRHLLRAFYGKEGEEEWARLDPARRALYNLERRAHFLPPHPPPAVDLYVPPPKPPSKVFDYFSSLARAIVGGEDRDGVLWQKLQTATAALLAAADGDRRALEERLRKGEATPEECRLAADLDEGKVYVEGEIRDDRPAHRPKTLTRKLAEHGAARILHIWDHLAPQERKDLKTVLREIKNAYGISRSQALKILKTVREREKR